MYQRIFLVQLICNLSLNIFHILFRRSFHLVFSRTCFCKAERSYLLTITLRELQAIVIFTTIAKNSDWNFNMAIYDFFFFLQIYYFELFRETSNTQLENDML